VTDKKSKTKKPAKKPSAKPAKERIYMGSPESLALGKKVYEARQRGETYSSIGKALGVDLRKGWEHGRAYCKSIGLGSEMQSEKRQDEIDAVNRAADARRKAACMSRYAKMNGLPPPGRSVLDERKARPAPTLAEQFALKHITPHHNNEDRAQW